MWVHQGLNCHILKDKYGEIGLVEIPKDYCTCIRNDIQVLSNLTSFFFRYSGIGLYEPIGISDVKYFKVWTVKRYWWTTEQIGRELEKLAEKLSEMKKCLKLK